MSYRTYRELYRSKTEITRIGSGAGAFKLGKYMAVGLDAIGLGVVAAIFPGILFGIILHLMIHRVAIWVWQFAIGFVGIWVALQFDPQGKSVLRWVYDLLEYFTRKHLTDGYKKAIKVNLKTPVYRTAFYPVDHGIARATPIYGKGPFTLHKPLGVKVKRNGTWILKRSRHPLEPGRYRIRDGEAQRVREAPSLRRKDSHNPLSS